MKRIITYIFIILIGIAPIAAQNKFTTAVKDGVNAVKEGFSPLTNLIAGTDSTSRKSKKAESPKNFPAKPTF